MLLRQIKNLLHCLLRYSEWSKLSWIIAIGLSWENANELRTISHRIFRISMQIKTLSCYFNYPQLLWAFFVFVSTLLAQKFKRWGLPPKPLMNEHSFPCRRSSLRGLVAHLTRIITWILFPIRNPFNLQGKCFLSRHMNGKKSIPQRALIQTRKGKAVYKRNGGGYF